MMCYAMKLALSLLTVAALPVVNFSVQKTLLMKAAPLVILLLISMIRLGYIVVLGGRTAMICIMTCCQWINHAVVQFVFLEMQIYICLDTGNFFRNY